MTASAPAVSRVLLVDDEEDIRELLGVYLETHGVPYDSAANGLEALDRIARQEYGSILLDLMMPDMDGFEVINALRSTTPALLGRVIVLTGGSPELVDRVDRAVFRVLTKPVALRSLLSVVQECRAKAAPAA